MSGSFGRGEVPVGVRQRIRALAGRARSLFVYLSFSSASNMVGLFSTLFMVRHVAPAEFGRLTIALGALLVANAVIGFGADNLVAINKTNLTTTAYAAFRTAYSHFALMTYAIAQVAALATWATMRGTVDGLVLLVPVMALTKFFVTMASIEYVMEQRAVTYGLVQFLTSVASAVLTVALVLWVSPKAESRIAALILADIALLVVRFGFWPRAAASWRFDREAFLRIVRFGAPLMLSVGPAYLLNESDKLVVAHQLDLDTAGIYGAACTIAGFMLTFITALLNAMTPRIMTALKHDGRQALRIVYRYSIRFCVVTALFATVFLAAYTLIAEHLLPARYSAAIPAVYVLVGMMLFRCFYAVVGTATDYFGMTHQKLLGIVIGACVTVAATALSLRVLGLPGAATGVGLGYAALGAWLTWSLVRRSSPIAAA
jgi:O-antigen/teichoic acid export membrane protein